MFDFSGWIDLPLIWVGLIAVAIFLYTLLDGFDLGVGILFPFAPSDKCRDRMMNSIAPFWDGNETWLVLGGGGLLAAFPLAYSIIMPAVYLPVIFMLLGLIFRGVAFEFRFKADKEHRFLWDYAFHFGSLLATFMQGMILGTVIQGIPVEGRVFAGAPLGWATGFSMMTGLALVFGYALLGATWLVMKTEDDTLEWSRRSASYVMCFVGAFMAIVSIAMPYTRPAIRMLWFSTPNFYYLMILPLVTVICFWMIWRFLHMKKCDYRPFLFSQLVFLCGFIGIAISIWPWLVPYSVTFRDAAAFGPSLSLLLVGAAIMLPVILAYTGYCYWLFRGKASHESLY